MDGKQKKIIGAGLLVVSVMVFYLYVFEKPKTIKTAKKERAAEVVVEIKKDGLIEKTKTSEKPKKKTREKKSTQLKRPKSISSPKGRRLSGRKGRDENKTNSNMPESYPAYVPPLTDKTSETAEPEVEEDEPASIQIAVDDLRKEIAELKDSNEKELTVEEKAEGKELKGGEKEVKELVYKVLPDSVDYGDKEILAKILMLLGDTNDKARLNASLKLREIAKQLEKGSVKDIGGRNNLSHDEVVTSLVKLLETGNEKQALESEIALVEIANEEDVPYLVEKLKKGLPERATVGVVRTLGEIGDRRAMGSLLFELSTGTTATKRETITALGKLNSEKPIKLLFGILRAKPNDTETRTRAAVSLGNIGTSSSEYALEVSEKYASDNPQVLNAIKLSLAHNRGELEKNKIDEEVPAGRKVKLVYKGMFYYFYHPSYRSNLRPKPRLLVCLHGRDRKAEEIFDMCLPRAKKIQAALLTPIFDPTTFPEFGQFNLLGERSDLRMFELVDFLKEKADIQTTELFFVGYGEGGDFTQRIMLTYPDRIAKAIFSAEKFISFKPGIIFPEGGEPSPIAPDLRPDLGRFLKVDATSVYANLYEDFRTPAVLFERNYKDYAASNGITVRLKNIRLPQGKEQEDLVPNLVETLFRGYKIPEME